MGLLMAWTSACLIMGIKIVDKGNAAFAFWSAAPFVAFFGYQLVQMRLPSVMKAAEFTSPFLLEMRVRIMLQESGDSPETLAQVDKLFELAMQQLSSSSMVHIIFAAYLQRFKKNRPLEMAQLAAAERKEPALDEYFLIYQRRRQVCASLSACLAHLSGYVFEFRLKKRNRPPAPLA